MVFNEVLSLLPFYQFLLILMICTDFTPTKMEFLALRLKNCKNIFFYGCKFANFIAVNIGKSVKPNKIQNNMLTSSIKHSMSVLTL